jgi:hypothetical protein
VHNRPLGKTGLSVSEIGYGAWGIGGSGWIGAQEDESVRALHRAIELGVTDCPGTGASSQPVRYQVLDYGRPASRRPG